MQIPWIFDWLVDQPNAKQVLETLCDRIAQRLLLGDGAITTVVGSGPVRAQHVVDLYESSQASMPACAIALATRLPYTGAIILVDRDQKDEPVVRYASVRPDPTQGWPRVYPWPGQKVPTAHPLRFITEAAHVQRRTYWATPWVRGPTSTWMPWPISSRRAIAVLADTDVWEAETFHPQTRREYGRAALAGDRRVAGRFVQSAATPVRTAESVHCPICGKCRCDRRNDELVRCGGSCFLLLQTLSS